jgi:predicted DNA-binding transcriptional regulator AlpA
MSTHKSKLLTVKNLQTLFGVSHMSIYGWRAGQVGKDPLPVEEVKDDAKAVGFLPAKVKAWAKKHKVLMTVEDPAILLGQATIKPGPKTKATVVEAKPVTKRVAKKVVNETKAKPKTPETLKLVSRRHPASAVVKAEAETA